MQEGRVKAAALGLVDDLLLHDCEANVHQQQDAA